MNPLTNVRKTAQMNDLELELGTAWDAGKSWHQKYKDSAWIFLGGLPYDLTEGDVISIFSQYGEIVNINLIRDHKTGKMKGFGFLCYEDQRSTILAVDNLNGTKILGRTIRVDHVEEYKVPNIKGNEDEETRAIWEHGCAPRPMQIGRPDEKEEKHRKRKHKKEKKHKKKAKKEKKKKKKKDSDSNSSNSESEEERKPNEMLLPLKDAIIPQAVLNPDLLPKLAERKKEGEKSPELAPYEYRQFHVVRDTRFDHVHKTRFGHLPFDKNIEFPLDKLEQKERQKMEDPTPQKSTDESYKPSRYH